jgi:hypothetical protein
MSIDSDKLKATDILVESIKLIFTISTIFFGGLLTYRSSISEPINLWACNTALFLFTLSSICSILNINSLIGKIFRSENDAIKKADVKFLNVISLLALLAGMILGAIFLSSQQQNNISSQKDVKAVEKTAIPDGQTIISESQIVVGAGNKSSIKVTKDINGRINQVDISSKEEAKPIVASHNKKDNFKKSRTVSTKKHGK